MSSITIQPKKLQGAITPPADKSISHRAIILSSLAQGKTCVKNLSLCQDCLCTLDACKGMGIAVSRRKDSFLIQGRGLTGWRKPLKGKLYLGNSGTSMRLILGVLAGQRFSCRLCGDASLSRRPMKRVIQPLSLMGAKISGNNGGEFAPLTIQGGHLLPISYETPVASAQVKSAILLAGLYASGSTLVREPAKSRDHTERLLKRLGADIDTKGLSVSVRGPAALSSKDIDVPGDISAASFFLVAACLCRGSSVEARAVGLNPTRTAFLDVLRRMGAVIDWKYQDEHLAEQQYGTEPKGAISAAYSHLQGLTIGCAEIPALIDELPVLMVAATQAEGETLIQGAGELRVKETDRIKAMVANLSAMGADIESCNDDIIIRGPAKLTGSTVESFADHRIAMSMAVAGLAANGPTTIKDIECVDISFPGFFDTLSGLLS